MNTVDTIAAVATGTGGAIGIIRIAGNDALAVANRVWRGRAPLGSGDARRMMLGKIGAPGEPALAVYMQGPASYTGSDVVELHCHGGNVAVRRAMQSVLAAGARAAEPGEFTLRAFVNGKLDLTRAEAVGDLIAAKSDAAFQLAARQLDGALADTVKALRETLLKLLSDCESRLDFPDEELAWDPPEILAEQLRTVCRKIAALSASRREGLLLRDGLRLVLAGRPNAGKSSLLNRLVGLDRAIVSAIPGTTRDTLEESTVLRGIPVRITDTAGLRETGNEIESIGVARARRSLESAQIVFWLLDSASPDLSAEVGEFMRERPPRVPVIAVWNKLDLARERVLPELPDVPAVRIAAATGENLDQLLDELEKAAWLHPHDAEPEIAVNARHAGLLDAALAALEAAAAEIPLRHWELAAPGLRDGIAALGKIVGEGADPDVLEEIFSRFCIGK